jgi:hypothetical protein
VLIIPYIEPNSEWSQHSWYDSNFHRSTIGFLTLRLLP